MFNFILSLIILLAAFLLNVAPFCENARILGVVPSASYSHQLVFRPIWRELARRGHELIVITTDPENDPGLNITEIDISVAYEIWNVKYNFMKLFEDNQNNPYKLMNIIRDVSLALCDEELMHPKVQNLLKNDTEHFDLVITEFFYPVLFGFSERFKCPFIGVACFDLPNIFHSDMGNPIHPASYPDILLPFEGGRMNFWQRLGSFLYNVIMQVNADIAGDTKEQIFFEKHFGKGLPPLAKIIRNCSMVFLNANPAFNVRPLGPSLINIGDGIHIHPPKPLPKDLKAYLDASRNGVIYFSLGTNVNSHRIPQRMKTNIIEAFRELPYDILWKYDADLPNIPGNVKILKWAPQQDLLRHPKIKVFITQGGLQSMEEALFSHVPIVAIPFFADQFSNVQKFIKKGCGVYLNKDDFTKESFREAVFKVINNPSYKQRTVEVAELSRDQPMTGLEKAVFWTEYVIRHKGARNFRNPMMDLPFHQYYLLDVIGFIIVTLLIFLFVSYKLVILWKYIVLQLLRLCKVRKEKES